MMKRWQLGTRCTRYTRYKKVYQYSAILKLKSTQAFPRVSYCIELDSMKIQNYVFIFILLMFTSVASAAPVAYKWPFFSTWTKLSMGLYWAYEDSNGQQYYCKANVPISKQAPGCENFSFNNSKPTVIFLPGWQPYSTELKYKSEFISTVPQNTGYACNSGKSYDQLRAWQKKGWNVGIFYWNQLADETLNLDPSRFAGVMNAQAKIWVNNGPKKMRWSYLQYDSWSKQFNVLYNNHCQWKGKACPAVKDMLMQEYNEALSGYEGNNLRIVGHSLGGQLAVAFMQDLTQAITAKKIAPNLMPTRMSLLDPYFSFDGTEYFKGESPLVIATRVIKKLVAKNGLIIDMYLSSDLTWNDEFSELSDLVATTWYYPRYYDKVNQPGRHGAAWTNYALSYQFNPPEALALPINSSTPLKTGLHAASASTKDSRIASMMGNAFYWTQYSGTHCMLPKPSYTTFLRQRAESGGSFAAVTNINISSQTNVLKTINGELSYQANLSEKVIKLSAMALPQNSTNKLILWQSSDPSIAKVYPGGYVKLLKVGKVVITAYAPASPLNNRPNIPSFKKTISLIIS